MQNIPPASVFYPSRSERLELVRRKYFDEGQLPSGAVHEAIFQSWARCQRLHAGPHARVEFQPVTKSRAHLALQKNRSLIDAWNAEVPLLESILKSTSCAAMLTDGTGVLIAATCAGRSHEHLMPIATRIGVNLSEEAVGTTAPGVVARTGQAVNVVGAEHFFDSVKVMSCSAAPIRDRTGRLAGVLDLSSELVEFGFDAASVVGLFASSMENRLLMATSTDHLVLKMQIAPSMLEAPTVGLVGIDGGGRVDWCNAVARRLLGLSEVQSYGGVSSIEQAIGTSLPTLLRFLGADAKPVKLPSGLLVWICVDLRASDGVRGTPVDWRDGDTRSIDGTESSLEGTAVKPLLADVREVDGGTVSAPDDRTGESLSGKPDMEESSQDLRGVGRDLIRRTLKELGGNVTRTARKLRVSRGLIYRHIRNDPPEAE